MISQDVTSANSGIEVRARSIVRTRDDFRDNVTSLQKALNSEIDRLAGLLAELEQAPNNRGVIAEIEKTLRVLREAWPAKKVTIEAALVRMLAELGLAESDRRP